MIMIAIIIMHILILMIIVMIIPVPASWPAKLAKVRKGTSVVSNDGVTANKHVFFDRGTFWVLPLSYFYTPRSARARLFPQPDNKNITFAAAPFVLTPFVRNQTCLSDGIRQWTEHDSIVSPQAISKPIARQVNKHVFATCPQPKGGQRRQSGRGFGVQGCSV